jgi:HEAT repeat protein
VEKFEQIRKALNSPDEEKRLQGVRDLAACGPVDGLDLLFEAFGDPSWRVRKESIEQFLRLPVRNEMIGAVIELLHAEENAGLRNAAVEILTRLGRQALPLLLEHIHSQDHDVRKFIIDILGDINAAEAVPTLIHALEDEDSNVRAAAAENLGKLKTAQAVPALLKAMHQPDLLLQFTILEALSRIASPLSLAELLPYKDEKLLRKALIDCLGKAGDATAIEELIKALTDPMGNVREAALLALVEIDARHPVPVRKQLAACEKGPVALTVARSLADENNRSVQLAAAKILGWLGTADAVAPLLDQVENESLQQDVISSLIEIGKVNPGAILGAWPSNYGNRRACLAYVLGEAQCPEGAPLLQQGLDDTDPQIVRMSAYALGNIGDAKVLPDLVTCLQSPSTEVQEAAKRALISLGQRFPKKTFTVMQPILSHGDSRLRMLAVVILRDLDDSAILDALSMAVKDASAEVRRAAIKVFERDKDQQHIGALLLSLTDEDADVRRSATEILANCDAEESFDGLQLALQDEDIWVRSTAVRGLGKLGDERCLKLVEKSISDPVGLVSIAALETLAEHLGAVATPHIIAALHHGDDDVVSAALNLLTRYGEDGWVKQYSDTLINHPFWAVRAQIARSAVEMLGVEVRPLLENRLVIETEEVVRQQLTALLDELSV